ncbi:TrmH family RNA methyltransferase [Arthrobacter caoxuetaonis]|uniref:RNA methyltransferase n=1 Tax=Arthrobacter caoxuetaonis TaxID=2886935 RepID=A0A9X1SCP6_9MICC|nr:RNA methyltransferase [Arthrobacter caoxuetaonis]MCC3298825.1 RNA methyltransferase [Arthrobacter caoxuetaonis]USQ55825.1 RNA methyltransferase [Arthrobacter caoxuetaonis]
MSVIHLESADDPRVSDYTRLTDTSLRRLREPAEGMYIAESSKVLRRAVEAGHIPRSFFLAEKWLPDLQDILDRFPEVPAFVGTPEILESITGFHLHRGALAAMHRPAPLQLEPVLAAARRVAILEDIVDHTNIGAIFRSAAALAVDAVLVSPQCADPLYRRSIRVSMGTVFQVPWLRLTDWPGALTSLRAAGFVTAALALQDDSLTLQELGAQRHDRLALVLGTEGDGLSRSTLAEVDVTVRIPMQGGVDSLNVAAASAVAFWECRVP